MLKTRIRAIVCEARILFLTMYARIIVDLKRRHLFHRILKIISMNT